MDFQIKSAPKQALPFYPLFSSPEIRYPYSPIFKNKWLHT